MPFSRPTLTALRNQSLQDITTSGVPGLDGLLRNAVLRVLAWVMSGLAYSVYGYLDWISKQAVPFTATDEFLSAWAALIGIYQKDATTSTGNATFTGVIGAVLPNGTPLQRVDAIPFVATADGTVDSGGTVTVPIASTVTGANTNCEAGTQIAIAQAVAGINGTGTTGLVTGGTDMESEADFRTRMLVKYAAPPQGGAAADYKDWALEVPGVTRAWVQTAASGGTGPGQVIVRTMFDDVNAAYGGFPQGTNGSASEETRGPTATGDQLAVAEHIWPLQPVTAFVVSMAPVGLPVDVTLTALEPNDTGTLALLVASLNAMFLTRAEMGQPLFPSDFYAAILATPGVEHFTMSEPSVPVEPLPGELPVMGSLIVSATT